MTPSTSPTTTPATTPPTISPRRASKDRATKETTIAVSLDVDGTGQTKVSTGLPFFDHMLSPARASTARSTSM